MQDDLKSEQTVSELLSETGFSSYEDLAAAKLSNYFRPRDYSIPVWTEELVRRNLRQFRSGITPSSEVISFMGAGNYQFDQPAGQRWESLLPKLDRSTPAGPVLSEFYLACARTLLGLKEVCAGTHTLFETWGQIIPWMVESRPGRTTVLVAESVEPIQRQLLRRLLPQKGLVYTELPTPDGVLSPGLLLGAIDEKTAAILVASPNYLGALEPTSEIGQIAHQRGALFGVMVDLLSLYMVRTPAEYRANFCLADWNTLGVVPTPQQAHSWLWAIAPLSPVPLAESTGLGLETSAMIAKSLLGLDEESLQRRFVQIWTHAHFLRGALAQISECKVPHAHPFFREFVVQVPGLAEELIQELEDQGIFPGVALGRDGFPRDWLLMSASELHQASDLAYFLKAFKQALSRKSGKTFTKD